MISEVYMAQSLCNKEDYAAKLNYKLGWFYCQMCLYSTLSEFLRQDPLGVPEGRECIHPPRLQERVWLCLYLPIYKRGHVADLL